MSGERLADRLDHIRTAAADACDFVDGWEYATFLGDNRTQQAIVMSLIIIGEAATTVMDRHPEFAAAHPDVPWRSMRGMRRLVRDDIRCR
ncbi:MAG: DUF86 domain-containing protein [Betaproteobacteria bacterium]|nr:DUF86 domain-containing protein [Betaproteobacteria bacterium]